MPKKSSDEMILEYINKFIEENGVSPSYMEIAARFNIVKSTVNRYLTGMKEKGLVDFEGHRSIRTTETQITKNESVKVPVLGHVSCGVPQYAEAIIEEYVRLPVSIFGIGDFYILRAHGDSMIDIGIEEDDLVLIKHQNYAEAGEVVVALIGEDANLKRFFPEPEKHRIRLHPENAVLAGEESADEAAVRERSIELLFSKKDLKDTECRVAFSRLCRNEDLLGDFGRGLLDTALRTTSDEALKWYEEALDLFSKELPSRIVNNLACCYAGLCLTDKFCSQLGLAWSETFPYGKEPCRKYLEYAVQEYLLDGGTSNQSVVEQTFEVMSRMKLDPKVDYTFDKDGTVLYIWLSHVYDLYTRFRKDYAITGEVLSYAQFKKQLMHSDLFIQANVQKRIGTENRKVWVINYEALASRCDVSGFEVTDISPL